MILVLQRNLILRIKMWHFQDKIKELTQHPIYKLLKNLKELWFVIIFWLMIVKFPFREPILELRYSLDRLYPPIASEHLLGTEPGEIAENSPFFKLINSRGLLRIKIRNNSSEAIQNVDLQFEALSVSDIAIHSNSSSIMAERTILATYEISDNFIVRFPNFTSMPPRAEIEMLIWGDIGIYTYAYGKLVDIFSSAETVQVVEEGRLSGIKLFVARHLSVLTIFLTIGLLLLGLKRYSRNQRE